MDFQLSEDQIVTRKWAHEFAEKEIRPVAADYDESEEFPWPVVKKAAEIGLYTLDFWTETVAQDQTGLTLPICMEETSWGCAGIGLGIFGTGLPLAALAYSATPEQFLEWGQKMFGTPDDPKVGAFAVSEPNAGSDAGALELAAEADGDGWRLTGTKTWISHAPDADVYTVFARTTRSVGTRGVTAFVVAGDAPGLTGTPIELIAPHALGTLEFDGVLVGPDQLLGDVDGGFRVAMGTLDRFRPSVGAAAVGIAQRALEAARAHADRREAFGGPLRELQAVAHGLADAATAVEAARLLVYEAAAALDAGHRATRLAAMAKLHATEVAQQVVDDAVQVHGAAGLVTAGTVAELYREVRALRIYEGASEVQRSIIARELYRDGGDPP
jgi:acyl-CoA dehydrogenase